MESLEIDRAELFPAFFPFSHLRFVVVPAFPLASPPLTLTCSRVCVRVVLFSFLLLLLLLPLFRRRIGRSLLLLKVSS